MAKTPKQLQKKADKEASDLTRMVRKMRLMGRSAEDIARVLHLESEDEVLEIAGKSLDARREETAESLCKQWMDRYEAAYAALAPALDDPEKCSVVGPRPIETDYPADEAHRYLKALTKWERTRLEAIMGIIKIGERVAKMKGLDAPKRTELSGKDGAPIQMSGPIFNVEDLSEAELRRIASSGA